MAGARPSGQSKDDEEFTHVAVARLHRRSVLEHSGQHGCQSVYLRLVSPDTSSFLSVFLSAMHGTFHHRSMLLSRVVSSTQALRLKVVGASRRLILGIVPS